MNNIKAAFVLICAEAERQAAKTKNDPVACLHACLWEVGMMVDGEMAAIRAAEREGK